MCFTISVLLHNNDSKLSNGQGGTINEYTSDCSNYLISKLSNLNVDLILFPTQFHCYNRTRNSLVLMFVDMWIISWASLTTDILNQLLSQFLKKCACIQCHVHVYNVTWLFLALMANPTIILAMSDQRTLLASSNCSGSTANYFPGLNWKDTIVCTISINHSRTTLIFFWKKVDATYTCLVETI